MRHHDQVRSPRDDDHVRDRRVRARIDPASAAKRGSNAQSGRAPSSVGPPPSMPASAGASPSATLPARQWQSWRASTSAVKRRFGGRCNSSRVNGELVYGPPRVLTPGSRRPFPHHRRTPRSRHPRPDLRDGPRSGDLAPHSCPRDATTDLHNLKRTALLALVLDQVNCVGETVDEGRGDHCGCPYFATAHRVAVERRSGSPPQGRRGFPLAHR